MYIEYTPIELFDEPDQHLQYPIEATTTIGLGIGGGVGRFGGGSGDSSSSRRSSVIALENGDRINLGDAFIEPKRCRRPSRRCSEYTSTTIKSSSSGSGVGVGGGGNRSYVDDHDDGGGGIHSGINDDGGGDSLGIPMGYDLLAKIRKLFGWGENSEGLVNRKRRAGGDCSNTSQFKYRKVESGFPKIITRSFEEDELNIVPQRVQRAPLVMAQQKQQQIQKEKKSSFLRPKTVTKHITNTAYADIEFSDDDDDEIIITNGRGESYNIVRHSSTRNSIPRPAVVAKSSTNLINIPFKQRQPPPPLIEARTGGILASTLMPDLHRIRQPTYSSVLQSNMNRMDNAFETKHSSPREQNVSASKTASNLFNGSLAGHSKFGGSRSILPHEVQCKDRELYSELLQKLVPNLYGIKGTSPKPTSSVRVLPALNRKKSLTGPTVDLTGTERKTSDENVTAIELSDDDVSEIIDLGDDEVKILSACSKLQKDQAECSYDIKKRAAERKNKLPYVEPVNTLKEKFDLSPVCKDDWLQKFHSKWEKKRLELKKEIGETEKEVEERSAETRRKEKEMQQRFKDLQIVDPDLVVIDDFPEGDEEPEFPEITAEHEAVIKAALFNGPADQTLISKFNMNITRRDISTLLGNNWLNDEVINFYMNLLTERGEIRQNEGLPKVYAMNTFFIPKLQQSGHSGVRRWTRKVDIFAHDIIPVPVHVGGVHWCMAIIHLRARTIKYYDSMGTPNPRILAALEQYLRDESLDKRKRPFDTSDFVIESVCDVPRQNNGSDCGVFSCMFAEYITRDREITFSQQHMEYFRHRMILEIVQGKLMQ